MSLKLYLSLRICVFAQSVFEIKYTNTKPVSMHISRAGKCVDDDDDDSGGRTQRDCLSLPAPDRRVSSSRPSFFAPKIITKIGGCRAKICNGYDPGVVVSA